MLKKNTNNRIKSRSTVCEQDAGSSSLPTRTNAPRSHAPGGVFAIYTSNLRAAQRSSIHFFLSDVSTVGIQEKALRKYIQEQKKQDQMENKVSAKEYENPFKGQAR